MSDDIDSSNMLIDALRWNMLNVIRVELFLDCWNLWRLFSDSTLQTPKGHYAIVSSLITLFAQLAVQFNFGWLLSVYSFYLAIGLAVWLYKRVYFYHRRLDTAALYHMINHVSVPTSAAGATTTTSSNKHTNGTLSKHNHKSLDANGGNQPALPTSAPMSSTSSSSSSSSAYSSPAYSDYTDSLQRQRAQAHMDFRKVISKPNYNHREFALSLAHLSQASKLVADDDVYDEMHLQVLATRRDAVNIVLRLVLFSGATLLAYFR